MLIREGFSVYGVDASTKMIAAFRKRFPNAHAECSAVEESEFFRRTFDGVVAWGLMFLLPTDVQTIVIRKVGYLTQKTKDRLREQAIHRAKTEPNWAIAALWRGVAETWKR